ncbi:hypothetical protein Nepgr_010636 [Nepenthes gracilis]|uniref:Uncharacterized protein n=1 Tax=Nepenthes gracilis TaxID=150966 RepID=A0AAD3SDJ6_NEPGR|nr:hypothetical protein Nepgr_010636 [Nepenthes gracilis]
MQPRRLVFGRPTGSDSSDFSFQMVVDSSRWPREEAVAAQRGKRDSVQMQSRRPVSGRPAGSDGSDFSFRMVVDSRYTKAARKKSHLGRLLVVQAFILMADTLLLLFPIFKGDAADMRALPLAAVFFVSLIIGESGRRRSQTGLLKLYMILSSTVMLLSIACTIDNSLILQVFQGQLRSDWKVHNEQLVEAILLCAGLLLQIFTVHTTVSLIRNMSPPKRSS